MIDWKPIETLPETGTYLLAAYEPTSWTCRIFKYTFVTDMLPRQRQYILKYVSAWAEFNEPTF